MQLLSVPLALLLYSFKTRPVYQREMLLTAKVSSLNHNYAQLFLKWEPDAIKLSAIHDPVSALFFSVPHVDNQHNVCKQ